MMNKIKRIAIEVYKKEWLFNILLSLFFCLIVLLFYIPFSEVRISDDLPYHLNRIIGMSKAILEGQLIPRVYPEINYGFGYGSPLFYPDLFLYPFALLYMIGVPVYTTYIIFIIFYSFLTSVFVLHYSRKIFKNNISACIIVDLLYFFSSYRLYDLLIRAAVGEVLAFTFLPIVLYYAYSILVLREDNYIEFAIGFSAVVLSHLISSVLFAILLLVIIILFLLFNIKDKDYIVATIKTFFKSSVLGIGICSFFVFSMLEQIRDQQFYCFSFGVSFNSVPRIEYILNLLNPTFIINTFEYLLVFVGLSYLTKKKNKYISIFWIIIIVVFFIITGYIPLPKQFNFIQFMFRLNTIIVTLLLIISIYVLYNANRSNKLLILLCFVASVITLISFKSFSIDELRTVESSKIEDWVMYDDEHYYYNRKQICGGEYLPFCNWEDYSKDDKGILFENSDYKLYDYQKNGNKITFEYDSDGEPFVRLPLSFYKGYKVKCDGENVLCIRDEVFKKVGFYLKSGKHKYEIYYGITKIQLISIFLTIFAILYVIYHKSAFLNAVFRRVLHKDIKK